MKVKATKKEIRESGNKIIKIGYCKGQYLLMYDSPFAYSIRIEGWACDYYMIGNTIISTGYAPIGTAPDIGLLTACEKKARSIALNNNLDYDAKKETINNLLLGFINEATNK